MALVFVDNGKIPEEPYNARLGFWLPADTPYGNLLLKLMKVCERIDEANRRLIDSYTYWEQCRIEGTLPINALQRHVYANEQAIYLLRRAADDIIALVWCLSEWERTQAYPDQIRVDCIGAVLKQESSNRLAPFNSHLDILRALNDVANAFKHSFVQSDITLVGKNEPCVHALGLDYNRLASGPRFHNFSLAWIAHAFSAFYNDGQKWLRDFSERHR